MNQRRKKNEKKRKIFERFPSKSIIIILASKKTTEEASPITSQDESAHSGTESREERVERERAHQDTVHELQDPREQNVAKVHVNQLQFQWGLRLVFTEEPFTDFQQRFH